MNTYDHEGKGRPMTRSTHFAKVQCTPTYMDGAAFSFLAVCESCGWRGQQYFARVTAEIDVANHITGCTASGTEAHDHCTDCGYCHEHRPESAHYAHTDVRSPLYRGVVL
jgi:ferredoxin